MIFNEQSLRARAASRLLHEQPFVAGRSDDDLNPAVPVIPAGTPRKPAAVLVPIVRHDQGLTLLLTQRHEHLNTHAGQIAFPGGRVEADESALAAALREAEEETGLQASFVEPLGYLDAYVTVTNFAVVPVVALVHPGFCLAPAESEVASIFEVPFSFLMSPENQHQHHRIWKGKQRSYWAMPYGERYIWGATAGMIRNLYERLYV